MNNDKTYNNNAVTSNPLDVSCKALEDSCMEGNIPESVENITEG